jgi:branched-chain amino acid transport system permease protein
MSYLLQQVINGLALGSIYALIAIGYTMVYGILGMINFAHGELFMLSAFISVMGFTLLQMAGLGVGALGIVLVLLVAMFFTAMYGWVLERVAYRPLRGSFRLAPLITAIGASIVLQQYVQLSQGAKIKALAPVFSGGITLSPVTDQFAVRVSYLQLMIFAITLILMIGFTWLIKSTSLGRSQRAVEQDTRMASLVGIDVNRTISITFVLGAALAAVAGVMFTLYYGVVDFFVGFLAGLKAFTAAVLGGIGSLPGAVLGGFLIGLIETLWAAYFTADYKDVAVFGVLVLVLLFKPTGLLGRPEVEKV